MAIGDKIKVLLANKAMSLNDTEKAQARANIAAAPDGFGFGTLPPVISDPDSLIGTADGIYQFYSVDHPIGIDETAGILIHYQGNFREVTSSCRQILYPGGKWAYHLERAYSGTWTEWEYVNPPMQLGVEYRTTERYAGKPVYVKAIDFGELPNNSAKSVAHSISNMDICFMVYGHDTENKRPIPTLCLSGNFDTQIGITATGSDVIIHTNFNASVDSAIVVMKYTKTTD